MGGEPDGGPGGRRRGFPFLEEPIRFTCVAMAMTTLRPTLARTTCAINSEKTTWHPGVWGRRCQVDERRRKFTVCCANARL